MYLICGEALYDVFVDPALCDDARQVNLYAKAGGSPHNVAIGLARLGCGVAFATEVSNDTLGRRLTQRLEHEGVDCSLLRRTSISTPLAMVDIDETGSARYAFHGLDRIHFHPELAEVQKRWKTLYGIHVGSIPIVSEQSADQLLELVTQAPERTLISFDPNVRLSLRPDVARWRTAVDSFRRYANLIKVGEDDLTQLYGRGVDIESIARSWLTYRCSLVIVTRGAQGAMMFSLSHPRVDIEPVSVVVADTVGAGDSFQAATLAWLAENRCAIPSELARLSAAQLAALGGFAARAAAITCRYRGPEFPRRKALD